MINERRAPVNISRKDFEQIGIELVKRIGLFYEEIEERPVTLGLSPREVRELVRPAPLPESGEPAVILLSRAADLLINYSLLNGHPKFSGYITSSPAPIGALADLLSAAVNPNAGAYILSPVATEIERQTVGWLAQLIGLPDFFGGLLVSGGNMANMTGFLAGLYSTAPGNMREEGLQQISRPVAIYCSRATHTWIDKAALLSGLGKKSIRWINTDDANQIDIHHLRHQVSVDIENGCLPLMIVGTAGDVSTGAVDDLRALAGIAREFGLWFHVDGAYGAPAAAIPELKKIFTGLERADSIAIDPHKWLYAPLEAGCVLVRDTSRLTQVFSSHPEYYNFGSEDDPATLNYYEYGLQNSRGFRALKVWLCLQQAGARGYRQMIRDDIRMSRLLYSLAEGHPLLEGVTQNLSITTFRFIPPDIQLPGAERETYLNRLNEILLNRLQKNGEVFLSNAVIRGKYCLRSCIVNFRTTEKDIRQMIDIVLREGELLHQQMQWELEVAARVDEPSC